MQNANCAYMCYEPDGLCSMSSIHNRCDMCCEQATPHAPLHSACLALASEHSTMTVRANTQHQTQQLLGTELPHTASMSQQETDSALLQVCQLRQVLLRKAHMQRCGQIDCSCLLNLHKAALQPCRPSRTELYDLAGVCAKQDCAQQAQSQCHETRLTVSI